MNQIICRVMDLWAILTTDEVPEVKITFMDGLKAISFLALNTCFAKLTVIFVCSSLKIDQNFVVIPLALVYLVLSFCLPGKIRHILINFSLITMPVLIVGLSIAMLALLAPEVFKNLLN